MKCCKIYHAKAGATVFTIEETAVLENESVINNIVPFNYMAYYLSELLQIKEVFSVGGKVTEVSLPAHDKIT